MIALTVEPDPDRVDEALRRAARKVAQKYTVPGYRKGKAPYAAVVRAYGKEALYEQVVEDIGDDVYREALEESGLEPIAPGELKDVSFDPLVFHLLLPMAPEVDLGDYRSVRVERTEVPSMRTLSTKRSPGYRKPTLTGFRSRMTGRSTAICSP